MERECDEKQWADEVNDIPKPLVPTMIPVRVPPMPTAPVIKKPGLFNKRKIKTENAVLIAEYDKQLEEYSAACLKAESIKKENQHRNQLYEDEMTTYNIKVEQKAAVLKEMAKLDVESKICDIKNDIEEIILQISEEEKYIKDRMEDNGSFDDVPVLPKKNAISLFLETELAEAKKQLSNAVKLRGKLYSYGIIHKKYRNQVALSTIYEYLDTGRCEALIGADGAYNLYESECRSNIIIEQLNQVVEMLEEIKKTQYMIYAELKQINSSINRLNSKMNQVISEIQFLKISVEGMRGSLAAISDDTNMLVESNQSISENIEIVAKETKNIQQNTAIAAYCSAVTAHYTKINTQLTNAVGFMLALK